MRTERTEQRFAFENPDDAIEALVARVSPVEEESVEWEASIGRVLAQDIMLDRDSPALDVSAMDGYALRQEDLGPGTLPVSGETPAGRPPGSLVAGAAVRVFTGAPIPSGAGVVVPRELVEERSDSIAIHERPELPANGFIRRRAENGKAGDVVVRRDNLVTPPVLGAISACGVEHVRVRRALRVGVLITGDEVLRIGDTPEPWQLRDGNAPELLAMLRTAPWIGRVNIVYAPDDPREIESRASDMLETSDAMIVSGGVSVGDHDHVPSILSRLGVETVFHRIPIRPGKPMLGGLGANATPVLGLPGNPVSTLVTARVFGARVLAARAGLNDGGVPARVEVDGDASAPPHLTWFALARIERDGRASLVPSRGSGDWAAAARSSGVVEIPPGETASGHRSFYPWGMEEVGRP